MFPKANHWVPLIGDGKNCHMDEMLKAEILWALKVMSHYSYKSCEGTSKLFQAMFPDSTEEHCKSVFMWGKEMCILGLVWPSSSLQTAFEECCEERRGLYL